MDIMKKAMIIAFSLFVAVLVLPDSASAQGNYYYYPTSGYQQVVLPSYSYNYGATQMSEAQIRAHLQQLILQLQSQIASQSWNYQIGNPYVGNSSYNYVVGQPRSYSYSHSDDDDDDYNDDEAEANTDSADDIGRNEAELRGEVDMNDFEDGEVFFVYGTDEDMVEDVEGDFDSYSDVDTEGYRLQKVRVDSGLDGDDEYSKYIYGLDRDEDYYFRICVGYEDEDDDEVLTCGDVEEFTTDN
jgi:hypothetical protein